MLLYIVNWADKAVYGLVAQPLAEELGLTSSQIGFIGAVAPDLEAGSATATSPTGPCSV